MNQSRKAHWAASEQDRKNQRRIIGLSLLWIVPFLAAEFAFESGLIEGDLLALAVTTVITLLGIRVLFGYQKFLRDADELMRKIQLDALALAFGVGIVAGFSFQVLESAGVVTDTRANSLIMIMIITYMGSVIAGQRRYS